MVDTVEAMVMGVLIVEVTPFKNILYLIYKVDTSVWFIFVLY